MSTRETGASVLVLANAREDRKVLFDTLDERRYDTVYTARDTAQARTFLAQDRSIRLLILDFGGTALNAILALCAELEALPARTRPMVLGLFTPGQTELIRRPPTVVREWLRAPVDAGEARLRLDKLLREEAADPKPVGPDLEEVALPLLRLGPGGQITTASAAARALFGLDDPRGRPFDELVLADRAGASTQDAFQTYFARLRRGRSLGSRLVVSETVGDDGAWLHLCPLPTAPQEQVLLEFLGGVGAVVGDLQRLETALHGRLASLGLDLLVAYAETGGKDDEPTTLIGLGDQGVPQDGPIWDGSIYREVLRGTRVVLEDRADKQRNDAFLKALGLQALFAVPIPGEKNRPIGALLAGARQLRPDCGPLLHALEALAGRLALEHMVARLRVESRARSLHDGLTRLPNRMLFNDRLHSAIAEAQRNGEQFAVLYVDLDRFKTINDSLGQAIGDQVLIGVARRLRALVRASDTVARYSGDEYALILRHIVLRDDATRIAEKLVRGLEAPLTVAEGKELQVTASIGLAFFPDDGSDAESLIKHADAAMFAAKGMGRNTYRAYVAAKEDSQKQRLDLEAKLRVAEKNRELRVYYQPQIDAESEDILGMEALIRWESKDSGLISPGFFIPLAEETGLIVPIGEWVLRAACFDCKRWQDKFGLPLRVGVNLSMLQLKQPGLVDAVERALKESKLPPSTLDLEITESISVREVPNLLDVVHALKGLGCGISIDDFGTGQSSLEYLKRFPADRIKIDQTFVRNIGVDPDDEAIVRATINMAHNLNRAVVAEGVETEDHLRFLRAHHCEELQGFLFCRPLPATSFENLLQERSRLLEGA